MSLWGSKPTWATMLARKACGGVSSPRTPTVLPFHVADRADPFGSEQLKAADMDPSQDNDRRPLVELDNQLRGEVAGDICLARAERRVEPLGPVRHVLHVGETLASQQVFGDIQRGQTEAQTVVHPEPRRFRRRLGSESRAPVAEQPSSCGG
jgi:hypothetical protein